MHLAIQNSTTKEHPNHVEDVVLQRRDEGGGNGGNLVRKADEDRLVETMDATVQRKRGSSRFLQEQQNQDLTINDPDDDFELYHASRSDVLSPPHLPNNSKDKSLRLHSSNSNSRSHPLSRDWHYYRKKQSNKVPTNLSNRRQHILNNTKIHPWKQKANNDNNDDTLSLNTYEGFGGGDSESQPEENISPDVTSFETPRMEIKISPTKSSLLAAMWGLVDKIKDVLLGRGVTTTPKPLLPCPKQPPNLDGPVPVLFSSPEWETLANAHPEVQPGGHWVPNNCTARHRIGLVIPFRDRDAHLRIFLQHMHPFLQHQYIDYTVYVVEQTMDGDFNRAMLMNVGFAEAEKLQHHDCFVFHDVDLLPEIAQNMYTCPHLPRHMSAAVDTLGYRLPYPGLFGGVSAMRTEHYRLVNGFSNCFFGWGGEDDDMYNRIIYHGLDITRYPLHIARYRMLTHKKEMPSNDRFTMLNSGRLRYDTDGVSSLVYDVKAIEKKPLYTLIRVHLDKAKVINKSIDLSRFPPMEVVTSVATGNVINNNINNNYYNKQEEEADNLVRLTNEVAPENVYKPFKRLPFSQRKRRIESEPSDRLFREARHRLQIKKRLNGLLRANRGFS